MYNAALSPLTTSNLLALDKEASELSNKET